MLTPGRDDVARAASDLAFRLPSSFAPAARLAYNYRWTWLHGGEELFGRVEPDLFDRVRGNPVRLLLKAPRDALERAADDAAWRSGITDALEVLDAELAAPDDDVAAGPIAFFCAEFGIHRSLHLYSGGLGVLAGDILKEASDLRLPLVGVGLMYANGNFRQRIAPGGHQEDYWTPITTEQLPGAVVTAPDGTPLTIDVPIGARNVRTRIWRVDVGRTALYLLDTDIPENDLPARWITSRLYVGDRDTRLEQYALLGVGGIRALAALGIDPAVLHLNEGHAAFAPLELARTAVRGAAGLDEILEAIDAARARTVFTTHTPVAAGNEAYPAEQVSRVLAEPFAGWDQAVGVMGAVDGPGQIGMTTMGLRMAGTATGVSELHGRVSRRLWRAVFGASSDEEVPIGSVTNGVHVPTWLGDPMRELLDRHLGDGWFAQADDPATWAPVEGIPDEELWAVRERTRSDLVAWLCDRDVAGRLSRDEPREWIEAAMHGLAPDRLTIGFARRAAEYKRLPLLYRDLDRLTGVLGGERAAQFAIAGKAHPRDQEAKERLGDLFRLPWKDPWIGARLAFVEDYDMAVAARLVAGCDVWLNLPRPPWEASGTSGMKAAMNGAVNASVLDGWWAEAYDGTNGFAIGEPTGVEGVEAGDVQRRDEEDLRALFHVLEEQVIPAFYERDDAGIPRRWVALMKASLATVGPKFSATRMVREYAGRVYGRA